MAITDSRGDAGGVSGFRMKLNTVSVTALCLLLLLAHAEYTAVAMTTNEQQQIVDIHNALRRGEGSSNMQILVFYYMLFSELIQSYSSIFALFIHYIIEASN